MNDKVLNCFKTKLFELQEDSLELKIPNDYGEISVEENKFKPAENLHGKWLIVNGNCIQSETKDFNDSC